MKEYRLMYHYPEDHPLDGWRQITSPLAGDEHIVFLNRKIDNHVAAGDDREAFRIEWREVPEWHILTTS